MQAQSIGHMFNFSYTKSSEEIVSKMKEKTKLLKEKVQERRERLVKLRAEYKITDLVMISLLTQARAALKEKSDNRMSYTVSASNNAHGETASDNKDPQEFTIGAGVVNNLLTETDFIEAEFAQIQRLDLIVRNLKDEEREWSEGRKVGHHLSESELKFLGF